MQYKYVYTIFVFLEKGGLFFLLALMSYTVFLTEGENYAQKVDT